MPHPRPSAGLRTSLHTSCTMALSKALFGVCGQQGGKRALSQLVSTRLYLTSPDPEHEKHGKVLHPDLLNEQVGRRGRIDPGHVDRGWVCTICTLPVPVPAPRVPSAPTQFTSQQGSGCQSTHLATSGNK